MAEAASRAAPAHQIGLPCRWHSHRSWLGSRSNGSGGCVVPVANSFTRDGFLGPVRLLTEAQCEALLKHFDSDKRPPPALWGKGGALTDWVLSSIGAQPRLLALLTPILGENIVLWGTSL